MDSAQPRRRIFWIMPGSAVSLEESAGSRSRHAGDAAEDDEDENDRRRVKARHQREQICERTEAVFADREGHSAERAERTERRELHEDAQDIEKHFRAEMDGAEDRRAAFAHEGNREPDEH